MSKEALCHKEVWVPSESPFQFSEALDSKTGEKKFILTGLMLPFDKVSRNNVLYNQQSITAKHKDLIGKPVMYNHKVDTDMLPKGHFIDSYIEGDGWHYKADIDPAEEDLIRKLGRGDLRHVSIQLIGGKVQEKLGSDGKAYTEAWVDDIIEGSIVPAPGFLDTTASFAEALHPGKKGRKENITLATAQPGYRVINTDGEKGEVIKAGSVLLIQWEDGHSSTIDRMDPSVSLLNESVSTTTGAGAMAPTQPLEKDDNSLNEIQKLVDAGIEDEKIVETIARRNALSEAMVTERLAIIKRARELLETIGEDNIIRILKEQIQVMKKQETPIGKIELVSYPDLTYLITIGGKSWSYKMINYSDAEELYEKLKDEAESGRISAPFTHG